MTITNYTYKNEYFITCNENDADFLKKVLTVALSTDQLDDKERKQAIDMHNLLPLKASALPDMRPPKKPSVKKVVFGEIISGLEPSKVTIGKKYVFGDDYLSLLLEPLYNTICPLMEIGKNSFDDRLSYYVGTSTRGRGYEWVREILED